MRDEFESSRYQNRHRTRKKNVILNSLITVVLLLIIIVSYNIFFSNNEPASSVSNGESGNSQVENSAGDEKEADEEDLSSSEGNKETSEGQNDKDFAEEPESEEKDEQTIVEESDDPDVIQSVVNPDWKPVGTEQTGEHVVVYEEAHIDWEEMTKAISYATGLSEEQYTIYFLGNNGPNKSVGTIETKDEEEVYRVYIEWVDDQGWKPTKVEELLENEYKNR